jgi:hypothetical protein
MKVKYRLGNLSPAGAMGTRNQVGIGSSYRPASLCSLATHSTQFQTWFLESIPSPIAGLKFPTKIRTSNIYISMAFHSVSICLCDFKFSFFVFY